MVKWVGIESIVGLISNIFLVSISSTFYMRIFCQYFGAKNYKAETFGFETFRQKDFNKNVRVKCWWNRLLLVHHWVQLIITGQTQTFQLISYIEISIASTRKLLQIWNKIELTCFFQLYTYFLRTRGHQNNTRHFF